jgi:hypothetical protein
MSEDLAIFGEGSLTFQEFAMKEPLPLAQVHEAVLEFLRGRTDAVLFGAHAVNVYVSESRMTMDVDILALNAVELADELCKYLNRRFHIAVRTRKVRGGIGYRIYQVQKSGNRHLVAVRPVSAFPPTQRVADVLVVTPAEVIAGKVLAHHSRRNKPKGFTDMRDVLMLLTAHPELRTSAGAVRDRLLAGGADASVLALWEELVARELEDYDPDSEFQ